MGYTRHTIAGFSWQTLFIAGSTAVTALKLMILARLLTPHDFGVFSLVAIALGIAEAITQTGINVTIVQSKQSIHYFLNTAWVIAIFRGFLIAIVVSLLGAGMAWFYNEPQLTFWIAVAALAPIIKGFINPAIITLYKNLQFFRDSAYRFTLLVVEAGATVVLAYQSKSVSAFVFGMIIAAVFEVVISFLFFRTRPKFEYLKSRATAIFANARGLSISAVLSYLNDNFDNFLVGKLLGVSALGSYQNSYALSHKPTYGLAQALSHSTLPIYSKLLDSSERLRRAFYRSTGALCVLIFLIGLPFFLFPKLIVEIILGEQWLHVVPAIPWLVAAGILHGIVNQFYTLFIAKQQYTAMNFHRLVVILLFVPLLVLVGQQYGLAGAAASVFFARLLSIPLILRNVWRTLHS